MSNGCRQEAIRVVPNADRRGGPDRARRLERKLLGVPSIHVISTPAPAAPPRRIEQLGRDVEAGDLGAGERGGDRRIPVPQAKSRTVSPVLMPTRSTRSAPTLQMRCDPGRGTSSRFEAP
jgi:hypothetical protein